MEETMTPCTVAEKVPKVSINDGMTVTGPIVPVSSLDHLLSVDKHNPVWRVPVLKDLPKHQRIASYDD